MWFFINHSFMQLRFLLSVRERTFSVDIIRPLPSRQEYNYVNHVNRWRCVCAIAFQYTVFVCHTPLKHQLMMAIEATWEQGECVNIEWTRKYSNQSTTLQLVTALAKSTTSPRCIMSKRELV